MWSAGHARGFCHLHPFWEWFHGYWGIWVTVRWVWEEMFLLCHPLSTLATILILFCFGLFSLSCFAFSSSMWLMVAGLMCDNYFLRCLEALSSKEEELQHCVLFCTWLVQRLRFSLRCTISVLRVVKKGLCHYPFPAFPQHNSQPCQSFGELPLWLLAKLSIFLLPLLDKHHVQQQINEWFSAVARGSGIRTSR